MVIGELAKRCGELIRQGRSTEAIAACDAALADHLSKAEQCRVLQLKAQALVAGDGRWGGSAIGCLKEALALTQDDPEEHGRLLYAFTAAYAALGSPAFCRQHHDAFVRLLEKTPSLAKYHPLVEYNLALAYHEVDALEEAEEAYLVSRNLCLQSTNPTAQKQLPYIEHNLVDVFQELDRHEEARSLMECAYPLLDDDDFGAQIRNRRAAYELHKGDLQSALLWIESGLGHPSCDQRTRAALLFTRAKVEKANGQLEAAHDLALEAMQTAALAHSNALCHRISAFLNRM